MRSGKSGTSWSQLWKRNAVVVAIALFVCAAVYLNWNYEQEAQAGKTLGQSTMVGSETGDPLVKGETGDSSALREVAERSGFRTLREDCRRLVEEGVTTTDEVRRILNTTE